MQDKVSLYSYLTLGILVLVGILMVVALVSFLMQGVSQQPLTGELIKSFATDPLYPLGAFFFKAFQWAAFLIPLFLFTNAFLLLIRPFPRLFLLLINLLLIPFLTLTLLVRMITSGTADELPPVALLIKEQFGQLGGTTLVLLLLILELVIIYQVFHLFWGKVKGAKKRTSQVRSYGPMTWEEKKKRRDTNNYAFSSGGSPNIVLPQDPRLKAFQQPSKHAGTAGPAADTSRPMNVPPAHLQPGLTKKRAEQPSRRPSALPQQPLYPPLPQQEKPGLPVAAKEIPAPADEELELSAFSKQGRNIEDAVYEHVILAPQIQSLVPLEEEPEQEPDPEPVPEAAGHRETNREAEAEAEVEADIETGAAADVEAETCQAEQADKQLVQGLNEGVIGRKRPHFKHYAVPEGLLKEYKDGEYWKIDKDTGRAGEILMKTLLEFNITAELTGICKGPVITMFELLPSPGVKLSKIVNLADNIALRLAASSVRIVAPIPGKHAVGIEIPNKKRATVSFKELISLPVFKKNKYEIPVVLGKDISGEAQIIDLVHTPHLLIAGATGSGKSVCVNSLIASILFKKTPDEVRLLLIDPKIVELKFFNDIPHLLTPVITEPKRSFQALQYCLCEMERRYSLLDSIGVRDVASFNRKIKEKKLATLPLPYIVIVIDEFADLMATTGKELESTIARLTAMSRAVGIHLVLATQRPSVDVITGLIKANIPSRIAFMVASKFDSRIIIDGIGAEKLLGKGDMLFTSAWNPFPVRIQGSFLTEEEVESITDYVKTLGEPDYIDDEIFYEDEEDSDYVPDGEADPLLEEAVNIILSANKASTSYLQRKLKIGYNRAARLIEDMEQRGIVGPPNGSKARDILHIPDRK